MQPAEWLVTPRPAQPAVRRRLWLAVLAHALLLGLVLGFDPIGASWREADTMAIAANLAEGGFDLLQPQVDWRGDTNGAVESEFPLYQALVGCTLGANRPAWPGRWLSLAASVLAALLWYRVLEQRCGPWPAWFGTMALVLGGQYAATATRVIPDPTSTALGVASLAAGMAFLRHSRTRWLLGATVLATLAVLAKPTSAQWLALAGLFACGYAPHVLRQARTWLATLTVLGALGTWLWHARQLGLGTGLTFGVTFGDTKAPHLEHLLQPGLWRAAFTTTLEFGAGPFGVAACLWLLARRRFDRGDAAVLAVAVLGVLGSLRYSHSGSMGPHYHAFAAFAGSWWLARATPERPGRFGFVLGLALVVCGGWHLTREVDRRTSEANHDIVALGERLRSMIPADERLIVRSGKPAFDPFWRRPNNYEEPVLFLQSRRRGFVLPFDGVTVAALNEAKLRGGRWYIDRIAPNDDPVVAAWLAANGKPMLANPGTLVIELTR